MKYLAQLLALITAAGCSDHSAGSFHPAAIDSTLTVALRRDSGSVVRLDSLGPARWTSMYLFGPYSPADLMRRCVQASTGLETYGIDARDDIVVMYFKLPDARVSSVAFPRNYAPFASDATGREYPRGSASFAVRLTKDGHKELTPRGALTRSCS
jgi:hypothetical protein